VLLTRWTVAATTIAALSLPGSLLAEAPSAPISDRIFTFLDKNNDNIIDSKEFGQIPSPMQAWLISHKITGDQPIKKADFLSQAGQMMDDLRRRRTRTSVKPNPTGNTTTSGTVTNGANGGETEVTVTPSATDNLPEEYKVGDIDRDGQIDFFEWRKFKPDEIKRFYELDYNRDSVLSLAELTGMRPENSTAPASSGGSTQSTTQKSASAAPKEKSAHEKYLSDIKYLFGVMDKNKNKTIDPQEWAASARMKPKFEAAKIDLKKPMTETQFTVHYQKIFPEKKSGDEKREEKRAEKRERKDEKRDRKEEGRRRN
jgi:hypothetical protein